MNPEFLNSGNSIPDPLTLDDILLHSEGQGVDWKLFKSSLIQEGPLSSASAFNSISKLRESLTQFKERLRECDSPHLLESSLAELPTAQVPPLPQLSSLPQNFPADLQCQLDTSQQRGSQLSVALASCSVQLNALQSAIAEANLIMNELKSKWADERSFTNELKAQLKQLSTVKTSPEINDLLSKNKRLAEQVKRNAQVFEQLSKTIERQNKLEQLHTANQQAIVHLKAEKEQVVGQVEEIVDNVQKILMKPGASNREKLMEIVELLDQHKTLGID